MRPPNDALPLLRAPAGIGARIAVMANGLSRFDQVAFGWERNHYLPLGWDEVFTHGVPGISFREASAGSSPTTGWAGIAGYDWRAAADRRRADEAFARIIAAMAGAAMDHPPPLAICARFWRCPAADPSAISALAIQQAVAMGARRVFILADLHRAQIAEELDSRGIAGILPTCPELPTDLDRTPGGTLAYLGDWKTLLAARLIVACDGPASALHPARAAETPIRYAPARTMQADCNPLAQELD